MKELLETIHNPLTSEEVTFVQTAGQTNGHKTVVEIQFGPRKTGPPAHYHTAFTETFEVLSGELILRAGKNTIRLTAGQQYTTALYQPHTFWSEVDQPTRFRGTIEPGSIDFENSFRISFGLARDGLVSGKGVPKQLSHLVILATMSQSNLMGVASFVNPLFRTLARTRRYRDIQRALIRRYCPLTLDPGDQVAPDDEVSV